MRSVLILVFALITAPLAASAEMIPRDGWFVGASSKAYNELVTATRSAIKENGLFVVTQAGPTEAAKRRGITIPGNTVIGAFNNDFAVRVLALSTPAMIEAPIRFYVTENEDGSATLSYKIPSFVFAAYVEEAGPALSDIAQELDTIFEQIAQDALE